MFCTLLRLFSPQLYNMLLVISAIDGLLNKATINSQTSLSAV